MVYWSIVLLVFALLGVAPDLCNEDLCPTPITARIEQSVAGIPFRACLKTRTNPLIMTNSSRLVAACWWPRPDLGFSIAM